METIFSTLFIWFIQVPIQEVTLKILQVITNLEQVPNLNYFQKASLYVTFELLTFHQTSFHETFSTEFVRVYVPGLQEVQGKHLFRPLGWFIYVPFSQGRHFVPTCCVQSFLTKVPVQDKIRRQHHINMK